MARSTRRRNPVAKNLGKFNKPKVFRDKTKYKRKDKYPKGG